MDWSSCIICGTRKGEPLKCPVDSPHKDCEQVYMAFLQNAKQFKALDALPVNLEFGPEVTAEFLVESRASWHNSCHLKFSNSKLERARNKRKSDVYQDETSTRVKRQFLSRAVCLFCGETGDLHEVMTREVDEKVRKMVTDLQDSALLKHIAGGDMIAIEAKYHKKCITNLTNRHRAFLRQIQDCQSGEGDKKNEARAFVELISFMESCVDDGKYVLTLTELHQLYMNRLQDFGIQKDVNKTRLKSRILSQFHGKLQEQSDGKNVLLVFNKGMASFLREELWKHDYESDALILAKAARIVRCAMLDEPEFHFDGSFPSNCQIVSVPSSLKVLISMLLNGSNIAQGNAVESQATLTISQLIVFNSKKKSSSTSSNRHLLEREPPLPLYVGLSIHAYTRSKKIINQLYQLGISVSYDRVDDVMNGLGTAVCSRFQQDGVVCTLNLNCGHFTVGALDNIDYNPSSTTAQGPFHGTGISLFQFPSSSVGGAQSRPPIALPQGSERNIQLPESSTTVPAVGVKTTELAVSKTAYTEAFSRNLQKAMAQKDCWAQHALANVD